MHKDETSVLKAVKPEDFIAQDAMLLKMAYKNCASSARGRHDVLIVKHDGKRISGTGMDTKVIGRIILTA
jgi:hypothetical protein